MYWYNHRPSSPVDVGNGTVNKKGQDAAHVHYILKEIGKLKILNNENIGKVSYTRTK